FESVLLSLGVAAGFAPVAVALVVPRPVEAVPGGLIPSGAGPASPCEIIPIEIVTIAKAIGDFIRGDELQRHSAESNGFCCQANTRNPMLSPPINAIPSEKLFRTNPLPCFNISPRTACAARYRNPP